MNTRVSSTQAFGNIVLTYPKVFMFSLLFIASIFQTNPLFAQCTLGCNDNVQVSLNTNCVAEVTVPMISPSAGSSCTGGNFKAIVMNTNGQPLATSPFVGASEIGKKLIVKILDTVSGQSCWGSILVEDKLPPTIACVNDTIPCSRDWKKPGAIKLPIYSDNCSANVTLTFVETVNDIACGIGNYTAIVTRVYTVTDAGGNKATCTKQIYLTRGNVADIVWPKHRDNIQAAALDCANPNTAPSNTGEPTISGSPLVMFCDFMATYTDQVKDLTSVDKVILRNWVVIDWCTGTATSFIQNIRITDTTPPSITCPTSATVSTSTTNCTTNYTIPSIVITDNCAAANKITKFITIDGDAITSNNTVLTLGLHTVIVKAVDDSNNSSSCTYTVLVIDNVPPVAVCDETTKVSLSLDGTAEVPAITFDDGSVDNCEIDRFEVARMGATVSFGPKVKFDCKDVNQTINVILRVWDKAGNYNDCTVDVKVEDKLNPKVTCPPDITLACKSDYNDFNLTGKAVATDNCDVTLKNIDLVQVSTCGTGTVKRTWIATDGGGRTAACIQYISLVNNTPFFINSANPNDPNDDVTWPATYQAAGCGVSLLPALAGAPILKTDNCDHVAVTYEDTELPAQSGGCLKVLRKWIVVDWCQYKPNTTPKVGYWEYIQEIIVVNNEPPVLSVDCKDVTFNTDDANCAAAKINYVVSANDDCTPTNKLKWTTKVDIDCNGNVDKIGNSGDLSDTYPVGSHCVYISVEDGCGNVRSCSYKIVVKDSKKPTPVCHHGLSTTLMATGMVQVTAKMFDGGSFDNCTAATDLTLDVKPSTFTCKELGPNLVSFTVTDKAGNSDFCTTYIDIQDNMNMCPPGTSNNTASIAGAIKTAAGAGIENVGLKVDGSMSPISSSKTGAFMLYKLLGKKYDVAPDKNDDLVNGVSTLDIVKITKHILGNDLLPTPYSIIAADVNKSGTVSTADVIALRKVILGIDNKFPAGQQSWRFIKSDFIFPTPTNPFETAFPEAAQINLLSNVTSDFVGVKVGDVNGSAIANSVAGNAVSRGEVGTVTMTINNTTVEEGKIYQVPVTINEEDLAGLQFTMNYDVEKLELTNVVPGNLTNMTEGNFAVLQNGMITASWNSDHNKNSTATFFTLVFRAKTNTTLSEALSLNSNIASAEGYTKEEEYLNVSLQFKQNKGVNPQEQAMILYQNQPNPFSEVTNINFYLPEATTATLKIMDVTGKIVNQFTADYTKGTHTLSMNRNELSNATNGIFYYQLQTATQTATKKMVLNY